MLIIGHYALLSLASSHIFNAFSLKVLSDIKGINCSLFACFYLVLLSYASPRVGSREGLKLQTVWKMCYENTMLAEFGCTFTGMILHDPKYEQIECDA